MIKLKYCKLFVTAFINAYSDVIVDNCTKGDIVFLFEITHINASSILEHVQYNMYGYNLELLAN
jgi:hypothetical protein